MFAAILTAFTEDERKENIIGLAFVLILAPILTPVFYGMYLGKQD